MFVPTSPTTNGFDFVMFSYWQIIELQISVEIHRHVRKVSSYNFYTRKTTMLPGINIAIVFEEGKKIIN